MLPDTSDFEIILSDSSSLNTSPAQTRLISIPSAFAWIDAEEFSKDFRKLSPKDPYSQLWDRFWGDASQFEVTEVQEGPMADAAPLNGAEDLASTAEEEDRLSGCRILDIGVRSFIQKLFIRADYIRIYDRLEDRRIELTSANGPPGRPAVGIVTGHPGVGKSIWVLYALTRRLAERKPTILHRGMEHFLFVEEGVYEFTQTKYYRYFREDVWALVDSDMVPEGLPHSIVRRDAAVFVVFETHPSSERWECVHGIASQIIVMMNPWTSWEIHQAALAQGSIDLRSVDKAFHLLGPLPSLCIDLPLKPREMMLYEAHLERTISCRSSWNPPSCFLESGALQVDKSLPLNLVVISRAERNDVESEMSLPLITPYVARRLTAAYVFQDSSFRKNDIHAYKFFTTLPDSPDPDALLCDVCARRLLKISTPKISMFEMSRVQDNDSLPPAMRNLLLQKAIFLLEASPWYRSLIDWSAVPYKEYFYINEDLKDLERDIQFLPLDNRQQLFHSFCIRNGFLYIFRLTTAAEEHVDLGLLRFFAGRGGVPEVDKWRFVFLIRGDDKMSCIVTQDEKLAQITFYTHQYTIPEK
ncbi:hypothetical protein SCP_1900460 [Sparassis crispa]|uniref:Uncharacterized protein n=1 Tax=Sparassis crispa TaxID=139825 RepID=A0A401H6Y1_9APHY|nr:hypothetical protein SCP_1900460 [Sparassis crispa]GBE90197.1 hypothetical protein SCP_1900460 [Sparassis crispa]